MKKIVLAAAAALVAISTMSAYAYRCNTQCFWVGNQQYCSTNCTMY
jgi:hypothetical protein